MNIINCSPFNGNYRNCGSFGPACQQEESGCGGCCNCCHCCCGCNCSDCGCGSCCPCNQNNGCGSQPNFVPTPQIPFACIVGCAREGRVDWGGAPSCGCGTSQACPDTGCGCGCNSGCNDCGSGSDCGCGGNSSCACAAEALLSNPCYGLSAIKCELDEVRQITGEIYNMMAPVPVCGQCGCNSCGC